MTPAEELTAARIGRDTAEALELITSLQGSLGGDAAGAIAACREEILREAGLAAHRQAACARDAVAKLAARVHAFHDHSGDSWLTCNTAACEESRRLHATTLVVHPPRRAPVPESVVAMLAGSLLCRKGEVIDLDLATERARNAACWVLCMYDALASFASDLLDDYEAGKLPEGLDDYANAARDLLAEIGGRQ